MERGDANFQKIVWCSISVTGIIGSPAGGLDSNSEMSPQNIPLKGRTDFRDAAEFPPQRPFAFELRCREYAARAWFRPDLQEPFCELRCQRPTLSSTISARSLPRSAVMRPTVMGRRKKRRGPALPGLKKSVPFFVSILGWCE